MSIISAGTTTTTALVETGDTTGNLVLQVNGTTPSLTLNTSGAHGVGASPSYGTSGQVLTSAGSAASPTWTTPSSGAMTLISTQTANNTSSTISWTGLSGYDKYMLVITNILPQTTGDTLQIVFGTGSSPTYITSNYKYASLQYLTSNPPSSGIAGYGTNTGGSISIGGVLSGVSSTGAGENLYCWITGMLSSYGTSVASNGINGISPNFYIETVNGICVNSTAKTAIKIYYNGNIASGTASLYGISS